MRYKREEGFRYVFKKPLVGTLQIIKVNEKEVESNPGEAFFYDLSPGGAKIATEFDLHYKKNEIIIQLTFELESEHVVNGNIVWQDEDYHDGYYYGIELLIEEEKSTEIIDELKSFIQKEKSNK
ncbi:PilZ domain-containing protein [Gracilibacillus massiliensis]|uniref:PilZ domain-containing protein n=1 Tax=Gracilibacillus massiliensis TaxID=1564956 RepID=UPI00071D1903|nr:PilZ domain-containing protein [Gracilibacillus massiliensis]